MTEPAIFETLALDDMNPDQRRVAERILSGPRGSLQGPFQALLRSPGLADPVQQVGEYIRFNSSIPRKLNELAIIVTARAWSSQFEWFAHHRMALEAGLDPAIADAIAEGRRPDGMSPDEALVHDFAASLLARGVASAVMTDAVKGRFGERGLVDLTGAVGFYCLVSFVLNVARVPVPDGIEPPLKPLPPTAKA